jgi:hypothetical protein
VIHEDERDGRGTQRVESIRTGSVAGIWLQAVRLRAGSV